MNRRDFLTAAASAAAATHLPSATPAPTQNLPADAPNILIFMPDQQYGATVLADSPVHKPHMDNFRAQAVTFTAAHCPAPHCCPSRTSFLTSLYPSEHGIYNNVSTDTAIHARAFPGTQFWSQWLRDAGYQMGYSGKLHVGRDLHPDACGFEALSLLEEDTLAQNQGRKAPAWQKAREEWSETPTRKPGQILRPDWDNLQLYKTDSDSGPKGFESLADYKIMQQGIAGMQRYAAAGKPWCVMISNSGAHDPYFAPQRFVDLYDPAKVQLPASFSDTLDDKPRIYQRQRYQYWSQLSDAESRGALRHYYAKCSMQDELFGQMLAALEATGQAANTIVLYVSDHGDYSAAHGLWYKGVPSFHEAYNIPAVIRWPKAVDQPGRTVSSFVDQVDFGATFLEATGIAPHKPISGHSLVPFLRNQTPANWRDHYCTQMNGVELYYTQRITATKDWKYVYNGFDYDELYDLRNDPHETRNLAFPNLAAQREQVRAGDGHTTEPTSPWPPLSPSLDSVRKDLLAKMWTFAAHHNDIIQNPYGTVALAPCGPAAGAEPHAFVKVAEPLL
jgi:arylsulfatase A-like enzyme